MCQGETISTVVEATALEMILELLNLPLEAFPLRTITTGATASNVLGLGKPKSSDCEAVICSVTL